MEGIMAAAADNEENNNNEDRQLAIEEEEDDDPNTNGRLKTIGEEDDQKGLGTQPTVKQLHGEGGE